MTNNPVAVFDSGIGSLSIIRELKREIPTEDLLYFADRAHFPYGSKSHNELRELAINTINYLRRYKPKLVVIASNTPSVQVLDDVKKMVPDVPIIGVSPPLKEASRLTKKKHIGRNAKNVGRHQPESGERTDANRAMSEIKAQKAAGIQ